MRLPIDDPDGDSERRLNLIPRPVPPSTDPPEGTGRAGGDDERIVLTSRLGGGAPAPRMLRLIVYRSPSDMMLVGRVRLKLLSLASESLLTSGGIVRGFGAGFGLPVEVWDGAVIGRPVAAEVGEAGGLLF